MLEGLFRRTPGGGWLSGFLEEVTGREQGMVAANREHARWRQAGLVAVNPERTRWEPAGLQLERSLRGGEVAEAFREAWEDMRAEMRVGVVTEVEFLGAFQ